MPSILKNFKAALKYANYDFSKLKNEIIDLIIIGRSQGLDNPDYCKLTIKNTSTGRDYPVSIDLYYKKNDQEAIHLPKELLIGSFVTIPASIKQILEGNGFVEIVINNLAELYISSTEEVAKPIQFEKVIGFNSSQFPISSRMVVIKDDIFAYRVVYRYDAPEKTGLYKVVTYADIVGIPSDVLAKLKTEGECSISID